MANTRLAQHAALCRVAVLLAVGALSATPLRAADLTLDLLLERIDQAAGGPRTLRGYFWRAAVRDPLLEPERPPATDLVGGWVVQVDRELAVWRRGGQCYVDEVQRSKEAGRVVSYAARRWRGLADGSGADLETGVRGDSIPRFELLPQAQAVPCLWGPTRAQITTNPQRPPSRQLRLWGVRLAGQEVCGALPDCYKLVFETVDPESGRVWQRGTAWYAGAARGFRQVRLERTMLHDPGQENGVAETRIVEQVERLGQVSGHWVPLVTRLEAHRVAPGKPPVLEELRLSRVVDLDLDVDLTDWLFRPLASPGASLFGLPEGPAIAGLTDAEMELEETLFSGHLQSLGLGPAPTSYP